MYPFSSTTGVKMIHDEMVQEALERQPIDTGEETQRPGLFQALGKVLARFNSQPAREQAKPVHGCA